MKKILISVLLILALALPSYAAEVVADRVGETSATPGTDDYFLDGARSKYQGFADGIGNGALNLSGGSGQIIITQ
jgi:hypothetical protein